MSFWVLLQILVDLVVISGGVVLWTRLHKPAKDDPRLSRGLQLLQSKIAVLEDLSDRTETQVSQLTALLETKCREIQEKITMADRQISKIDSSAQKSLEVAKIFQDRIPHTEIVERQNTIKYVKAARLAHVGHSIDEIASQVDLTRAEIEFIAKVNREQLQFSEEDLPAWAREEAMPVTNAQTQHAAPVTYALPREHFAPATPQPTPVQAAPVQQQMATSAPTMQAQFVAPTEAKTTIPQAEPIHMNPPPVMGGQVFMELDLSGATRAPAAATTNADAQAPRAGAAVQTNGSQKAQTSSGKTVEIRPVNFPRIDTQRL